MARCVVRFSGVVFEIKMFFRGGVVMRTSIRVGLALLLLIGLLGALETAWGQEVTAAIVGSVEDPSGAPIKAAAVVARDTDHGVLYTAQTNDSGAFNLQHLPIGTYDVKVTAPGFDTAVHAQI